jgi:hypothetical protein
MRETLQRNANRRAITGPYGMRPLPKTTSFSTKDEIVR